MLWTKKKPDCAAGISLTNLDKHIDQAYAQGAREERRQIVELLKRLLVDDNENSDWFCAISEALSEIEKRG
jgi:predicted outer membrane protein